MNLRFIWGLFMVLVYIGVACLIVFTPMLSNAVSNVMYYIGADYQSDNNFLLVRIIAGILLLAYGLFRGYRIWKDR
jgi:uncharacterized BrkB/YihY/UPF0761 family membrane protein